MGLGGLHQMLAACLQQAAVGGVRDRLGHHRGVHDHLLAACLFDHLGAACRVNAQRQQRLHPFFPDALSPAREAAGIDGWFGLQVGLATEVLPVRVLHPGVHHRLVRRLKGVLQVQQARHQPRAQRRPPSLRGERHAEVALDLRPVDQGGQADEGMTHVQQLIQAWAEQLGGLRLGRLRASRPQDDHGRMNSSRMGKEKEAENDSISPELALALKSLQSYRVDRPISCTPPCRQQSFVAAGMFISAPA